MFARCGLLVLLQLLMLSTAVRGFGITSRRFVLPSTRRFCAPLGTEGEVTDLSCMEIRVGKIIEIGKHPEADSLYVEKVDCGEASGPRTIVSGLVKYCTVEQLLNSKVTVLCNLKPRALVGITSAGMLLCASNADGTQVVPLIPPEAAPVGQLITFAGHKSQPEEPGNRSSKAYKKIADDFFVNDDMVATFKGVPFMTPAGVVTAALKGKIS